MLIDRVENLSKYYSLDDKLRDLDKLNSLPLPTYYGFAQNKESSTLFLVNDGSALFTTSWREDRNSRDVTGAIRANKGEFVLYLPGESILVKAEEDADLVMYLLESKDV